MLVAALPACDKVLGLDKSKIDDAARYIVFVVTELGIPSAATGDFGTFAFPYGQSTNWSRTFQIVE